MTTPSGYPGNSNDPYGTAGEQPGGYNPPSAPGGYQQPAYQQPSPYPGPDQYSQYPGGNAAYPPPQPYGQPGIATGARPGMVTAAAVLAFVVGGLAIIGGLIALAAGGIASSYVGALGGIFIVLAILILAVGAVYIWAGVLALQGKNAKFLIIVAGIAAVLQLISMLGDFTPSSLLGLAISVGIIVLMLQPPSKQWFAAKGVSTF